MLDVEPARIAKFIVPVWPDLRDNVGVNVDLGDMTALFMLSIATSSRGDP